MCRSNTFQSRAQSRIHAPVPQPRSSTFMGGVMNLWKVLLLASCCENNCSHMSLRGWVSSVSRSGRNNLLVDYLALVIARIWRHLLRPGMVSFSALHHKPLLKVLLSSFLGCLCTGFLARNQRRRSEGGAQREGCYAFTRSRRDGRCTRVEHIETFTQRHLWVCLSVRTRDAR